MGLGSCIKCWEDNCVCGEKYKNLPIDTLLQMRAALDICIENKKKYVPTYYVAMTRIDGKFADGYFGWDGNIHSDEQIFELSDLPYTVDSTLFILVGVGEKPSVDKVQRILDTVLKMEK